MAKVYSWAISETKFGYIINPNDVDKNVLNGNANPYITDIKLTGDDLNAVKIWASTCSDDEYIEQFTKLKDLCRTENIKVNFENVESYLNVSSTCDNLSGPEGKEGVGIVDIRYKEDLLLENKTRYEIELSNGEIKFLDIQNGAKGDKGDNADKALSAITIFAYKSGVNENGEEITIDTPTGGSYNFTNSNLILPEGWSNTDSVTPPIFMSSATFKTTKDSDICNNPTWNTPIQITGDNGEPGADGITTEFIYKRTSSNRLTEGEYPSNPTTDEEKKVNEFVPDGWSDSPSGVDEDHKYEWMSIRKFDKNSGMWREWSTPALWSKYGENGQDGDGVQYIYTLTEDGTPPSNPCPDEWADDKDYQEKNREWLPGTDGNIYDNALGKYIKWTDNPSGTTTTNPYEWVCVRKYKQDGDNKKWGQFSNPSLWAKYGENGKSGTIVRKLYRLMKNSNTSDVPDLPQEDYYGQWTSSFPSNFNIATDVVWETEAELYADTYEFVGRYKNAYTITETENSSGDVITTITNPTTDKNGNIIVPTPAPDNIIPNEKIKDSEGNLVEYIKTTLEGQDYYYKWSEGWDTPKIITGVKGDTSAPINDTRYLYYFGENMPSNEGLIGVNFTTFEDSDGGIINGYTWYNFPYASEGVDNDTERWYRCLCYVNGSTYSITSCGNVEINSAIDGEYTEYRYCWAKIDTPPNVDDTNPIKPGDSWSTTIDTQGDVQFVLWQISARLKRDKITNTIVFANDGGRWVGPIRITGEKGETGKIGFPGIGFKALYCLGTKTTYFGENPNNYDKTSVEIGAIPGWYGTQFMRDSNIIKPTSLVEFDNEVKNINNVGRVIQWTINDSGSQPDNTSSSNEYVGKIHYYFIKGENDYVDYTYVYPDITEGVYTWMTQGETVYDDKDKYKVVGYNWSIPVKAQGTAGVNGVKGRVIYPAGNYNPYKVYETTADSAPYVYDTSYGNFYLLNAENFKWLGEFDEVYYNSLPDDEKKKYYVDDNINNGQITDQNGQTPGGNYANTGNPYWIKFESLQALYASVAVINMGTVGSAVYADDFMFSQYGLKKDGRFGHYNDNSENNFLSGYERQDDGSYKYNETTLNPEQIDPYQKDNSGNYIHDFMPSICINFKTGKMWVQNGKIIFGGSINPNDTNILTKDEQVKTFYGTNHPTLPYKIGDLWLKGESQGTFVCKTNSNGSFDTDHWEKVDDTDLSEIDYLRNTFDKGETNINGGSISTDCMLTKCIGVKNGGEITALINGDESKKFGGVIDGTAFAAGISNFGTSNEKAIIDLKHTGINSKIGVLKINNNDITINYTDNDDLSTNYKTIITDNLTQMYVPNSVGELKIEGYDDDGDANFYNYVHKDNDGLTLKFNTDYYRTDTGVYTLADHSIYRYVKFGTIILDENFDSSVIKIVNDFKDIYFRIKMRINYLNSDSKETKIADKSYIKLSKPSIIYTIDNNNPETGKELPVETMIKFWDPGNRQPNDGSQFNMVFDGSGTKSWGGSSDSYINLKNNVYMISDIPKDAKKINFFFQYGINLNGIVIKIINASNLSYITSNFKFYLDASITKKEKYDVYNNDRYTVVATNGISSYNINSTGVYKDFAIYTSSDDGISSVTNFELSNLPSSPDSQHPGRVYRDSNGFLRT